MEYKAIPFVAKINQKGTTEEVALQLQNMINTYSTQGWEYLRLENVETWVAGDNGCFGIGAKPGHTSIYQIAIFKR